MSQIRKKEVKPRQLKREANRRTAVQQAEVEPVEPAPSVQQIPDHQYTEVSTPVSFPFPLSTNIDFDSSLNFIINKTEDVDLSGGYQNPVEFFKEWSIFYNMRRDALEDLLRYLRSTNLFPNLPITQKTLLGTPAKKVETISVKPGEYVHFGLEHFAKELHTKIPNIRKLLLLNKNI